MNYQGRPGSQRGIEWLQPPVARGFTWNPVIGCTNYFCEVRRICWAGHLVGRCGQASFEPRFYESRLTEPLHRRIPSLIGAVLMGDLFCDGVPDEWIGRVLGLTLHHMAAQHIFIVLTKNPARLGAWGLAHHPNLWAGTSISEPSHACLGRVHWLSESRAVHKMLSIEPYHHPIDLDGLVLDGVEWILIGGQSRPDQHPEAAWVKHTIEQAHARGIPVLVKRNAGLPDSPQEWPASILKHLAAPKEGSQE